MKSVELVENHKERPDIRDRMSRISTLSELWRGLARFSNIMQTKVYSIQQLQIPCAYIFTDTYAHPHTHTHIFMYIYIYMHTTMCLFGCVLVCLSR